MVWTRQSCCSFSQFGGTIVALIVTFLPCALSISGQQEPLMIFWDEKKSCGISNVTIDRSTIRCGRKKTDEFEFYTVEHNDLTLRFDFMIRETAIKAILFVENEGSKDVPVNVTAWVASSFKTYEAFLAGEKPLLMGKASDPFKTYSKSLGMIALQSVTRPSASQLPSNAPMTNTATTQSANVPGTTMKQDQPPPKNETVLSGREVRGENDSAKDWKVVRAKTELRGAVAFATVSDSAFRLIALDLNGVVYIFPVGKPDGTTQKQKE